MERRQDERFSGVLPHGFMLAEIDFDALAGCIGVEETSK